MSAGPDDTSEVGIVYEPVGTHTSRTIMLPHVTRLFAASTPDAGYSELRQLVLDQNILQKASTSGRTETFRRLRELYGLDTGIPVYRALRRLWHETPNEHPMLALLCALARDPVLRESAELVLPVPEGSSLAKSDMEAHLVHSYPERYTEEVLAGMTRRILSSWTQSGHLSGRSRKLRTKARSGPGSTSYALVLGHLEGLRGNALFDTVWVRALDAPEAKVHDRAFEASRRGWITYLRGGSIVEVRFGDLLNFDTPSVQAHHV